MTFNKVRCIFQKQVNYLKELYIPCGNLWCHSYICHFNIIKQYFKYYNLIHTKHFKLIEHTSKVFIVILLIGVYYTNKYVVNHFWSKTNTTIKYMSKLLSSHLFYQLSYFCFTQFFASIYFSLFKYVVVSCFVSFHIDFFTFYIHTILFVRMK